MTSGQVALITGDGGILAGQLFSDGERLGVRLDRVGEAAELARGLGQVEARAGEPGQRVGTGRTVGPELFAQFAEELDRLFQEGLAQPTQLRLVLEHRVGLDHVAELLHRGDCQILTRFRPPPLLVQFLILVDESHVRGVELAVLTCQDRCEARERGQAEDQHGRRACDQRPMPPPPPPYAKPDRFVPGRHRLVGQPALHIRGQLERRRITVRRPRGHRLQADRRQARGAAGPIRPGAGNSQCLTCSRISPWAPPL